MTESNSAVMFTSIPDVDDSESVGSPLCRESKPESGFLDTPGRIEDSTSASLQCSVRAETSLSEAPVTVIEYTGIVNEFDGDIACVTLFSESGDQFEGSAPIEEFTARRICEGGEFKCRIERVGNTDRLVIVKVDSPKVTVEMFNTAKAEVEKALEDWSD